MPTLTEEGEAKVGEEEEVASDKVACSTKPVYGFSIS
jgi:hypothetical protein